MTMTVSEVEATTVTLNLGIENFVWRKTVEKYPNLLNLQRSMILKNNTMAARNLFCIWLLD
jgi:hypothetical protein